MSAHEDVGSESTVQRDSSGWSIQRSDFEIACYIGGLYDEIAERPVFAHSEYPGPVQPGTIGAAFSAMERGQEPVGRCLLL